MSEYDYLQSLNIERKGYSFVALLMALMQQAGPDEMKKLVAVWPDVWAELVELYNTPEVVRW
mgnify:CR=1 FL=1